MQFLIQESMAAWAIPFFYFKSKMLALCMYLYLSALPLDLVLANRSWAGSSWHI